MKILSRYIGSTVIISILMVILVLISLEIFIEFTGEFSDMGTGNYGLLQVLICVFMHLPGDIYRFFPMAGLIGCLMGLGWLAQHSELIVMRAAGVSLVRITGAVICAAFLITLVAVLLGEVVAPTAQHTATIYKAAAMSSGQEYQTQQGIWVRDGHDYIHIDSALSKGRLQAITRYHFNNHNLASISFAREAKYQDHGWVFQDISETKFLNNKVISNHYAKQKWQLTFNPRLLGLINIDSDQRSIPQLYVYIKYLHGSGLQANRYEFDFWQRIFQPLATLVMILLAVPFIFGPLRTVPMGLRILAGIAVGASFYMVNQFIAPISIVYQLSPLIVASMPTIVVAGLGFVLLLRTR